MQIVGVSSASESASFDELPCRTRRVQTMVATPFVVRGILSELNSV